MKRFLVLLILAIAVTVALPSALFAQSSNSFTSYYKPGNVAVGLEVGPSFGYSYFSLAAYPSVEVFLAKYSLGDVIPIDIGVEAKGRVGLAMGYAGSGFGVGAGALAMAHFGFRGMPGQLGTYLGRFDLFLGLGITVDPIHPAYSGANFIGFASTGGFNYFFNDSTALTISENYWNTYADSTIGIRLKFGSAKAAKKAM